jgi:predicted DNA-binding ribbon-helix-helix protein
MKSQVVKRSIVIGGHKTSVSLEDAFWKGLKEIAGERNVTLSHVVAGIDTERERGNLSSAIRLFVLGFYRSQIMELGADPPPPERQSEICGDQVRTRAREDNQDIESA